MRNQVMEYDGPNGLTGARIEPLPEGHWNRLLGNGQLCLLLDKNRFCVFEINYIGRDDAEVTLRPDPIEVQADCVGAGICTEEEYHEIIRVTQTQQIAVRKREDMAEYHRLRNMYGSELGIKDTRETLRFTETLATELGIVPHSENWLDHLEEALHNQYDGG